MKFVTERSIIVVNIRDIEKEQKNSDRCDKKTEVKCDFGNVMACLP